MRPSPSSQAGRFSSAPSTPLPRSGFVQSAALGAQLTAAVLEVSDELFLLRVDRDRRLAGGLPGLHPRVDVFELGVAVGVACALAGLAVGLQAEAEPAQQSADQLLAGGEAALGQRASEVALALADPQQGGLGIATDGRLHQLAQSLQQARLRLQRRPASTARAADAAAEVVPPEAQFGQAAAPMVLRATPVAVATAVTPPRPAARASLAVNRRRPRSSRNGAIASKRVRMPEISITPVA